MIECKFHSGKYDCLRPDPSGYASEVAYTDPDGRDYLCLIRENRPKFKTLGEEAKETKERIDCLRVDPKSATPEDVLWLILKLEAVSRTIVSDGYYC